MDLNELIKEQVAQMVKKDFVGIDVDGYENGFTVSTQTMRFPREKNPYIEISSTLLIPEKYYKKFKEKVIRFHGVRAYIAHLLAEYKLHIANGMVPSYRNHTTKYQEKNQNLIKVAFKPNLDDWAELKLYRTSFGMSISAFIVYLLIADFVNFAKTVSYFLETVGIPTSPNFDLWAKVYLSRKNSQFTTVFQYRNSLYG